MARNSSINSPAILVRRRVGGGASNGYTFSIGKETAMSIRPVKRLIKSKPTTEGAGVHLRRGCGVGNKTEVVPFLLAGGFRTEVAEEFFAGFPRDPRHGGQEAPDVVAWCGRGPGKTGRGGAGGAGSG